VERIDYKCRRPGLFEQGGLVYWLMNFQQVPAKYLPAPYRIGAGQPSLVAEHLEKDLYSNNIL
jgi:hypothetical protein